MTKSKPLSADESAVEKIDLSKYRSAELVGNFVELISIPKAATKIFLSMLAVIALVALLFCGLYLYSGIAIGWWVLLVVYGLIVGGVGGLLCGILRVIHQALNNIESILAIVLKITSQAADDYGDLSTGSRRMPSGGELMEQAYEEIILPSLEEAVGKAFGFLRRPMLWAYRRTIGSAVRFVIKKTNRAALEESPGKVDEIESQAKTVLSKTARYSDSIKAYTTKASSIVQSIGSKIRFFAMSPFYVLLAVGFATAALPVFIMRCLIFFQVFVL